MAASTGGTPSDNSFFASLMRTVSRYRYGVTPFSFVKARSSVDLLSHFTFYFFLRLVKYLHFSDLSVLFRFGIIR
jgi:hypothetical protein